MEHFRERALVRLGLKMSDNDILEAIRRIQNQESEFIERKSNNRTVHKVLLTGKDTMPGRERNEVEEFVLYHSGIKMLLSVGEFLVKGDEGEWVWHGDNELT